MAAPEITDKFTMEGILAVGAAVAAGIGWVFRIGQKASRMETRIDALETRDKQHDAQLEKIESAINKGLDRIQSRHEAGLAELRQEHLRFVQSFIPNANRQGGD